MDTEQIKVLKFKLRDDITRAIMEFQEATGCSVRVDVDETRIDTIDGSAHYLPVVSVQAFV